jgi:hypothetical protein
MGAAASKAVLSSSTMLTMSATSIKIGVNSKRELVRARLFCVHYLPRISLVHHVGVVWTSIGGMADATMSASCAMGAGSRAIPSTCSSSAVVSASCTAVVHVTVHARIHLVAKVGAMRALVGRAVSTVGGSCSSAVASTSGVMTAVEVAVDTRVGLIGKIGVMWAVVGGTMGVSGSAMSACSCAVATLTAAQASVSSTVVCTLLDHGPRRG